MRQAPGHSVSRKALGAALAAERVVHACHDPAGQHRPIGFQALPDRDETEFVQAREGNQVRGSEGRFRHVEVCQMGSVRTSILGDLDPSPEQLSPPALHPQLR